MEQFQLQFSYNIGTGVTHRREVNIPWNGNKIDHVEWDGRLGDHLFSVNNKVKVGSISTTSEEETTIPQ